MIAKTHCPRCGSVMQPRYVEGRTREVCASCQHIFYRNPVPAVGVVVALDGRLVLVRRKFEPRSNYWSLPAGYMELGESTEQAAIRECQEETGLLVQIDALLGVYSFGVAAESGLLIIYTATAVGGNVQAGDDAAEVGAFPLDNLPRPMAFSTHMQAIEHWRQRVAHIPIMACTLDLLLHTDQGVLVRHAHDADDQRVLALLALVSDARSSEEEQRLASAALFHSHIRSPDTPVLVAEVEGAVVGFATVTFHRALTEWRAAIDDLVVDPNYRRRGVGQALVEAAAKLAQSRQCHTLHLDVSHGATDVHSFCRACGFAEGAVATLHLS